MSSIFRQDGAIYKGSEIILGMLAISLLTVICSLPLFTAGASITAGYYAMAKCVRKSSGYIFKEFFRAFRTNFKTATGISVVYILIAVVVIADFLFLRYRTDAIGGWGIVLLTTAVIFLQAYLFFICFVLSRFDRKGRDLAKYAALMMFKHIFSAAGILLLFAAAVVGIFFLPIGFALFPGIAFYGSTFIMERVLRQYMPEVEPGSPESEKWYYK